MIDQLFSLTLDINRFDASTKKKVLKIITKAQKELILRLNESDLTSFNRARTAKLLKESKDILALRYKDINDLMKEVLDPIPEIVIKSTAKAIESKLPADLSAAFPTEEVMKTMVNDTLILGSTASDWWSKQEADTTFRYSSVVRQGLSLGETNQQIVKRVQAVMETSSRNARSLVQTSISSVSNKARDSVFQANSDVVKGTKWITALDSKVCELCYPRADKEWKLDGTPIKHNIGFQLPPIHYADRCVMTAITKSFEELGFKNIKEPKPGERASVDGPVSSKTTFESFLSSKSKQWQDDVLGVGRADMWRNGTISLENLINGEGRPLTLKELKEKYMK